jgi:outer membrane biosynthesis protein TonB
VSTPSPAALAQRRRRLLALHRRHAGRVRAIFYWLGAELEAIDDAVLRCFLLAERHGLLPSDARAAPWLGHLAWRVASRPGPASPVGHDLVSLDPVGHDLAGLDRAGHDLAGHDLAIHDRSRPRSPDRLRDTATPTAPKLPPAADALARFLATHAVDARSRAALVLSEFAGLGSAELATLLSCELGPLHAALRRLRQALASDPEVAALGGPRSLLAASLAPFLADLAWTRRHAALLAAHTGAPRPVPGDILRRPAGIIGLGLAAIALLLLLRPAPPIAARPRPAPLVVAVPRPPPAPAPAPAILPAPPPVPETMSPEPSTKPRLARVRTPRKRPSSSTAPDALARREQQARSRDPGAIIIELEMIGAGRKALAASPAQALAYADQHARDYPESQLVTQRAELRVRALCALGRRDEARAEAERRGPGKVRDALKQACGL